MRNKLNLYLGILFSLVFLMLATPALANWLTDIGISGGQLIPTNCTGANAAKINETSGCGLNDMLQVVINLSTIIVGVTGTAALAMFTYGGVMFIISAGNTERVQKAKTILTNGAVGIVIIFTAWMLVNFIILALTKGEVGSAGKIFGDKDWYKIQDSSASATKKK